MPKIPLIIDCDPGVDDAVALFLAFASPGELELLAITTTAGNVEAALTARNARLIRQIAGREDVPVYAGCPRPMVRAPVEAGHFHGETGLGTLAVFEPDAPLAPGHAVDAIVQAVAARPPGTVTIAVTGPMTNLAAALVMAPEIAGRLARVVAMGGARREGGNVTASAEFNIFADPHAAQVVFASGVEVVVLGLDATHQVRATAERLAAIAALATPAARACTELLAFSRDVRRRSDGGDAPLHDPCTIAWLLASELFADRACRLEVETASPLTLGHTAVEFRLSDTVRPNARWVTGADGAGVFALIAERLARP